LLPYIVWDKYSCTNYKETDPDWFDSFNSSLRVVDFGCGSGRWAIEVGEQYPGARVYGVDISPIQPTHIPLNVEYVLMDVTEGLDFEDGSTDLAQSR
jgi:SAM-dependent methyltransferase